MAWYLFQFKKIEKVVVIILHDLAYSLLMYFYFARFKEWIITIYAHFTPISRSESGHNGRSRSSAGLNSPGSIILKKPTSLQITPATIFVPLLDFFLQVLPLIFQLFKRIRATFQNRFPTILYLWDINLFWIYNLSRSACQQVLGYLKWNKMISWIASKGWSWNTIR